MSSWKSGSDQVLAGKCNNIPRKLDDTRARRDLYLYTMQTIPIKAETIVLLMMIDSSEREDGMPFLGRDRGLHPGSDLGFLSS